MDGILNVDKPVGPTSFDIVRLVKRLSGQKRVGHGGTLDPLAGGVLPIFLGRATRVSEFLLHGTKAYRAEVRLGVSTNTYDAEGEVTREADASAVGPDEVAAALTAFRGRIQQRPPAFSALKKDGRRSYELAREGRAETPEPRPVEVMSIELTDWSAGLAVVEIECGHGTYVRSIAHDLGESLGCGAHLSGLERTRTGPFLIEDALTIEALHDAALGGYLETCLEPLDTPLLHLPAAIVDAETRQDIIHGKPVARNGAAAEADALCRAFNADGELVALLRFDAEENAWRPTKVFAT